MTRPLRLLLVEDSDRDAAFVTMSLRREGWSPEVCRVETRDEMLHALRESAFDAVVSDHQLPRFSAPEALETLRSTGSDLPFIVVSGSIGEDTAVKLMRGGASDYLVKDRLSRLSAALERELQQAEQRRARRRAESLFQAVLRASPHPSAIIDGKTGAIVDGSNSFARAFLGGETFPVARPLSEIVHFSQAERVQQIIDRGTGTAWHTVYYVDGIGHVANVRTYTVEHEGGTYVYVVIEDVTEQHYLKAAFDAVNAAVLIIGSDHRLLYANRTAEELYGSLYFGMEVGSLLARPSLPAEWWLQPTASRAEPRVEISGRPYAATTNVFRFAGEPNASTILTLRSIAEEEELQRLATHDALTGVFNVRYFDKILPDAIAAGGCLAFIDLDYFKPINDTLGHAAGDAALIQFVQSIRARLLPTDTFARLGGDEFAVLFAGSELDDACQRLQGIYEHLETTPFRFESETRPFSASCGIAQIRRDESAEDLKLRADRALYDAKNQGRGRFVVAN